MKYSTVLSFVALVGSAVASDVLDLNKDTFAAVANADLSLIEFFAPWCGHCKALAPHYEEAATILKDAAVNIAKVDCTVEADLCAAHGVSGYPTIKVFRKGASVDYAGPRKTDGIVSYMRKQSLPAVSDVTLASHAEFQAADRIVLVAYLDEKDEASKEIFSAFAELHRDDYLFGISHDAASVPAVTPPAVVLYKSFDEGRNDYEGVITAEGLNDFVADHSTPLLDEISPDNFAMYSEAGLPLAFIFVESTDPKREAITKAIEPIAREYKGTINFVWIDATKFGDHAKSLNLLEPVWPAFAIQNIQAMTKFPLSQTKAVDFATVSAFVKQFVGGEIQPSVKSQPVPTSQDESVYVMTADSWDDVVAEADKDLFVFIHAPWCGHCKKLKPTWETLGDKYNEMKRKLTIAKFDATENDLPTSAPFKVAGFPTIKFKAAGSSDWATYEGDRSFESLVEYLDANAVNDINTPDEPIESGSSQTVLKETAPEHHDEL